MNLNMQGSPSLPIMNLAAHGCQLVENAISAGDCDTLIEKVATIDQHKVGSRRLLKFDWCRDLAVVLRDRLVTEIPELSFHQAIQCTYFNKSPAQNWFVAWHQDRSMPVLEGLTTSAWTEWTEKDGMLFANAPDTVLQNMYAIRLHLDDATANNGALRILPRSHQHGTLAAEQIATLRQTQPEVIAEATKGDAFVMRPLLLHASSKSVVDRPRRVLHFIYSCVNFSG